MITGIFARRGSLFISSSRPKPSSRGISRSLMTSPTGARAKVVQRVDAVDGDRHLVAVRFEHALFQRPRRERVVDDEDLERLSRVGRRRLRVRREHERIRRLLESLDDLGRVEHQADGAVFEQDAAGNLGIAVGGRRQVLDDRVPFRQERIDRDRQALRCRRA